MQVGDLVRIKEEGTMWDNKVAKIEKIWTPEDSDKEYATCYVDFIPEEGKRIRQDFALTRLVPFVEESLTEDEDDDIDLSNDEVQYSNHVIEDLAKYFEVDVEDVNHEYDNVYSVNGTEYWVGTQEEAYREAIEEARSTIEDMGLEALSDDYREYAIEHFLDQDEIEEIMRDYNEGYVNDIEYEDDDVYDNRLISELVDANILTGEDFDENDALKDSVDLEEKKEEYIDYLTNEQEPYDFLTGMFGGSDLAKFINDYNLLDYDSVAEDCVETDGVAHFMNHYDGETELEIGNGLYAYEW